MPRIHLLFISITVFILLALTGFRSGTPLKTGDIVFISNPSGQGKAIQLATKSKYTHVGIVFVEKGIPYVYHAVEPVTKSTFEEFVNYSADGKCVVKRL